MSATDGVEMLMGGFARGMQAIIEMRQADAEKNSQDAQYNYNLYVEQFESSNILRDKINTTASLNAEMLIKNKNDIIELNRILSLGRAKLAEVKADNAAEIKLNESLRKRVDSWKASYDTWLIYIAKYTAEIAALNASVLIARQAADSTKAALASSSVVHVDN